MSYPFKEIQKKWQETWQQQRLYSTDEASENPKYYALTMFPYPSGDLHIGHWYAMVPSDTRARYMRMQGHNVLFPMGFDAFGLPAENAAINHNIHPWKWTKANIEKMRGQLKSMGAMFDWDREVITCDPAYYKWNQWLFLQLYKHGLAYKKKAPVDWCPQCNTTLAREQVVGEEKLCERCDTPVSKRELNQWFLKITDYADELLDFSGLNWPERVKLMQANWIGRSEGVEFSMTVDGTDKNFSVFTTRIDTIFGVSFVVLAPEHPLVAEIPSEKQRPEVENYVKQAARQTEIERLSTVGEKDGVFTGAYAIHPLSGEKLPIYIADYVLMGYGSGAIMAVPAHDQRDHDFAKRYDLSIPQVIQGPNSQTTDEEAYTGPGKLINSGAYNGLDNTEAIERLTADMEAQNLGKGTVNYRLRDWLVSRQRYWGTPIPFVQCDDCGLVPVPEDQLPVELPDDAQFTPTGESPLKHHSAFLNTTCPKCSGPAQRETDTMDTFFDSSWYQYRYVSPKEEKAPFNKEKAAYWLPVDQYTGGIEHATMHLLYTRFFTKAMRDMGLIDFSEPMLSLFNQGIILGEDAEKMSKSRGNVVAPDDLVDQHGADTVRAYLMFMAPWDQGGPWSDEGIGGVQRFLNRVWRLAINEPVNQQPEEIPQEEFNRVLHKTIKKVTSDMEQFKFNTMLSAMMEMTNMLTKTQRSSLCSTPLWHQAIDTLLMLLAPVAPFMAEELWQLRGYKISVHLQPWPQYDPEAIVETEVTIPVQINGKLRDTISITAGSSQEEVVDAAMDQERIRDFIGGEEIVKVIYVPDKLLNLVVK